jgi:hypothetical protein
MSNKINCLSSSNKCETNINKRIERLLEKDVENGNKEAIIKLSEFRQDPKQWLQLNFNPKTYESISYPDWKVWTIPQD